MIKFFNVFLLNLLIFSGRHYCINVPLVDTSKLDQVKFEIKNTNEHIKQPYLQKRSLLIEDIDTKPKRTHKRHYLCYKASQLNLLSPERQKCRYLDKKLKRNANFNAHDNTRCNRNIVGKWKNARHKKSPLKFASFHADDDIAKYLDYTNSQMPFNEGKCAQKNSQEKSPTVSGETVQDKNILFKDKPGSEPNKAKRSERAKKRHLKQPLMSLEKSFDLIRDDPLSDYSRVRRFLDHVRTKKWKKMQSTLQAKEAAMSPILDPNLNLDGSLEPHVRKRRDEHLANEDLKALQILQKCARVKTQ